MLKPDRCPSFYSPNLLPPIHFRPLARLSCGPEAEMAETMLKTTNHDLRKACPRLSVAMIVRSCQEELAATLRSVRDLADELVILDTGSTDGTREVASQFAALVIQQPWQDDFAAARNACLKHVSGEWVLWLDAGE